MEEGAIEIKQMGPGMLKCCLTGMNLPCALGEGLGYRL